MNYNSIKNQEIKGKLVNREVVYLATPLIVELQQNEVYQDEILEAFYSYPDYDQAFEDFLYNLSEWEQADLIEEYGVTDLAQLNAEQVVIDKELEPEFLEPYEFWIVTNWLADKLREKNEIVAEFMGFNIWGRLTTGQAILLDDIINRIAEDIGILEGMENEW